MKKQTFIVSLEDQNGIQKDFYRFTYKKASTCLEAVKRLANGYGFIKNSWISDGVEYVTCYATPDGYNKDAIAARITLKTFL